MFWRVVLLLIVTGCCRLSAARDYFVAPGGIDSRDGLSPKSALKTLAAAASRVRPGDVLRLQRGGVWRETLRLTVSGEPQRPIRVTAYGGGDLPTIDGSAGKQPLDLCIDASASYITIDSIRVTHAAAPLRGAIMIWADHDLAGITIQNCQIVANAGRGVWIAGDPGKSVRWVFIDGNLFKDNAGSGVQATKINVGWITNNIFTGNCSKTVDAWQAAVRVWSGDIQNLLVAGNHIDNGVHHLDRGGGMGIHVDETGPGVVVSRNDIRHCDAAGIELENTARVTVSDNVIFDAHVGVLVYRAGHHHLIAHNTIFARSQGIVLQGLLAHGVDAGPEVMIDGELLTGNVIDHNVAVAQQWGSLKLVGGGERVGLPNGNVITANAFGPQRPGLIEFGNRTYDAYAPLTAEHITSSREGRPPFADLDGGDLKLPADWLDYGAR